MALRDMEYDRPRFEQGEIAFFIGRNLPERLQRKMRGFLHLTERKKANLVWLTDFFKRPANPHVARQSPAAVGRSFKGGDSGGHWKTPGEGRLSSAWVTLLARRLYYSRHISNI